MEQCTQQRSPPSSGQSLKSNVWAFLTHDQMPQWSAHQYSHGLSDVTEIKLQIHPWWRTSKEGHKNNTVHIFLTILYFSTQKDTKLFTSVLTLFSVGYSGKMSRAYEAQWSRTQKMWVSNLVLQMSSFMFRKEVCLTAHKIQWIIILYDFFYIVNFPVDTKTIKTIHLPEFHLSVQEGIQLYLQ